MKAGPERLSTYLQHILQSINRIASYTAGLDESGFAAAEMVQDAVIRNFESLAKPAAISSGITRILP